MNLSPRVCFELLRLRRRLPGLVATLPLDELLKELDAFSVRRRTPRAVLDRSVEATEALIRRGRLAPDSCLFRALSRYALLQAHGVEAAFCLGVNKPPDHGTGHAWVEDADGPYLEEIGEGAYIVTFTHPPGDGVDFRSHHELRTSYGRTG